MKKRVLSMFMALALCLTLLPTAAFAEGEDVSISGGVIGGGETGGEGGGVLVSPGGSTGEGGGIYVAPGGPTEGGGGTYTPGEATRTEIWCVSKPDSIGRGYDGTTDGGTIPIDLTFTDGTDTFTLKEGTGFTAKKTFDSADAGSRTVTVEIELIGDAAAKYKLKAGEETFTIGGNINKAYPKLTVSLSQTTCTAGEKILPLLSVSGVQENAAVTYFYTPIKAGYLEFENSDAVPKIDENTAISEAGTYYVYAKTGETKNYKEERSATVELTVSNDVASVTTSSGVTNNYTSLDDALNAVKDGDTVTLLSGAEITRWHSLSKAFTLELSGKTATTQSEEAELYLHARVIVQDSSTEKTGGMAGTALLNVQPNGDLIIKSGTFNGRIAINDGKLTIKGGTFNQEVDLRGGDSDSVFFSGGTFAEIWYPKSSGSFLDLLADGYAFYDNDGKLVNAANSTDRYLRNVKVKEHQHSFTDGACACGYTCPHTSVDESGACTVCGKQFAASITEDNDVTYYDTFTDALVYATKNDGCTLKLLADVTGTAVMINNPFIFDLNGHSVDALSVNAKATIKDSGTTKGTIKELKVFNIMDAEGDETVLTVADLLEEGYAFKSSSENKWYFGVEKAITNVTVQPAPIKSVVLDAIGTDKKEVPTTMAYGTTGAVTLEASCWINDLTVPTYTWYKLEGAAATTPMEGVNGAKYKLPADLPAGKHTYRVTCTSDHYSKSAEITITVTKIDIAKVPEDKIELELVYGGNVPYNIKGEPIKDGVHATTISLVEPFKVNGTELTTEDYTLEGNVQYGVGEYTLKINVNTAIYTGSIERTWHVIPRKLGLPGFPQGDYEKTYDGGTSLPESIKDFNGYFEAGGEDFFLSPTVLEPSDYTLTNGAFENATVGEDKRISFTLQLKNKNYEFNTSYIEGLAKDGITVTADSITYTNCIMPRSVHFNITPAPMPNFDKEVTLDIVNDHADTYTVDLSALLPKLESPRTYGDTQYEVDQSSVKELTHGYNAIQDVGFAVNPDNGKTQLTFHAPAVENQTEGSVGAIKITVTPTNYKPVTLTVNLRAVNKQRLGMFVSVATDPIVYGMTLGDIKLSAEATVGKDNQVIPGTIAWEDPLTTVPAAGRATYRWTFTPDDTMHYLTASNTINFLVEKATPTGAPTYAAITTGGKTLADAALKPNASWPSGTVQWVDKDGKPLPASTQVQANTEYTWSFTPADAANYNGATGSVTLYAVSSGGGGGGGGSSSSSKPSTTTRPDGTKVQTETKADGTKVETTTGKDGSTVKTTTNPNGSSVTETKAADGSTGTVKTDKNGNTEAETKVSAKAVEDAKKSGDPVKAPVEVKASRDSSTAPTVKIELPRNSGDTEVEIPVTNVKPGTVAVLVHPDGTEEIVKNSLPTEDGIQLTVNGGATVKIVDNSKGFIDTQDHWAKDAIDFVSARGLVSGMSGTTYAPDASTTRAQLWTILARQNNADLTGGATWFENAQNWAKEKGISDGANPNGTINRAQVVTMLWRAAGSPAAGGSASFADVPADSYYTQAVAWAVEGGITTGVGGGRFDPNSTCTRAQIATFLWRAMAE